MHWQFPKNNSLYKNKRILRAVDQTIVEQGRWSVFGHLLIFVVVEWLMGFRAIPVVLSYSFALVLLAVALSRLFYLLNFTHQYGRGPARWRHQYGLLTLLGAGLWSAYLTLTIIHPGYTSSLTFVWIYTAAVAATHIFIFAAYRSMAQWYNGLLLIPPGIAGIAMLQWEMVTLGIALLLFFAFMELTSRQVSARFWETQRSRQSLELALGETSAAEHQAALQAEANQHSLVQLIRMIRQPLGRLNDQLHQQPESNPETVGPTLSFGATKHANELAALLDQFELYMRIKALEFDDVGRVFSINRQIEQALLYAEPLASIRGLDLSCAIHPDLPERLLGQAQSIQYLLHQSLLFAIAQAQGEEVTLKVDASTDAQTLVIKLRYKAPQDEHYWQQCQTLIRSDRTIESFPAYDESLLSLAICVLLIRHQSGTLSLVQTEGDVYSIELAMTVPVEVTTQSERRFQAHKSLHDRRIWIAGFPAYGTRALEAELKSWGLEVDTFSVEEHVPTEAQYDFGLYNVSLHHVVSPPWLTQVIGNTQHDVAFLYSPVQSQLALAQQFAATTIRKPWLRRSLHRWLVHQLQGPEHIAISAAAQARLAQAKVLLVSTDSALTQQLEHIFVPHGAILKTAHNVASFKKQTHQMTFDMILMDVEQTQLSYHEMTADFRQREREQHIEPVPIVTLSSGQHDSIVLHGLMFGADQLTKPLQTEHLFDCLERFWG